MKVSPQSCLQETTQKRYQNHSASESVAGGDMIAVAGMFPSAAPQLGNFAALGFASVAVTARCLQTLHCQGKPCFPVSGGHGALGGIRVISSLEVISCSFLYKPGKLYSLVMSQATDCRFGYASSAVSQTLFALSLLPTPGTSSVHMPKYK